MFLRGGVLLRHSQESKRNCATMAHMNSNYEKGSIGRQQLKLIRKCFGFRSVIILRDTWPRIPRIGLTDPNGRRDGKCWHASTSGKERSGHALNHYVERDCVRNFRTWPANIFPAENKLLLGALHVRLPYHQFHVYAPYPPEGGQLQIRRVVSCGVSTVTTCRTPSGSDASSHTRTIPCE